VRDFGSLVVVNASIRRGEPMNLLLVLIFTCIFIFSTNLVAQSAEDSQKTNQSTIDKSSQARLYKEQGEQLISQDKTEPAADAFSKALSLDRDTFSPAERVRMAIYLSWADRLQEAEKELNLVLAADPKNRAARTHLARVLGWSGELTESIAQAETVLKDAPDDQEALLVKADSLRWQGREREALPIYQELLQKGDNFDARVGLSYCLLATGKRVAAQEQASSLKSANPQQEKERKKLADAISQEASPQVDFRYNYYTDSDGNRLNRYSLLSSFWLGDQKFETNFRHTDANDKGHNRAEDLAFKVYSHLTDWLAGGVGLGFTQLGDGEASNFPTGQIRLDAKLFKGNAGANVTREVLSDTAELIHNAIRMTNVGLYLSQPITDRFSAYGGYNYKDFSDGNHANDLQLSYQYAIYLNPRIAIGHRFRYLDFLEQSHSGYFDPNNYVANRAFVSFYIDRPIYYTYLEGFLGHQRFRRNFLVSNDFIHGGSGSIGIKPLPNLAIEVNAEGGNFAAGTASGFTYFIIGPRLLYRF
jgi:thioredoxin-like negative regulator of GroEL